ncbi:MAG: hypothetical protein ACRDPW_02805 [Mycobacteriales bacterium]
MTVTATTAAAAGPPAPIKSASINPRVHPIDGLRQTFTLAWRTIVQVRHNPWELGDFSISDYVCVAVHICLRRRHCRVDK